MAARGSGKQAMGNRYSFHVVALVWSLTVLTRAWRYSREQQGFGLWNINRSAVYRELTLPLDSAPYVTGFDFSPDGRSIALINPEGLHLFDVGT